MTPRAGKTVSEMTASERAGSSDRESRPDSDRALWGKFYIALALLTPVVGGAVYLLGGREKLAGFGAGLVLGGLVALVGLRISRRGRTATGAKAAGSVVFGLLFSFLSFVVGVVVLGLYWDGGLVPASLTALALYFGARFVEVLASQRELTRNAATSRRVREPRS